MQYIIFKVYITKSYDCVNYQKLKICAVEMNLQTTEWGEGVQVN